MGIFHSDVSRNRVGTAIGDKVPRKLLVRRRSRAARPSLTIVSQADRGLPLHTKVHMLRYRRNRRAHHLRTRLTFASLIMTRSLRLRHQDRRTNRLLRVTHQFRITHTPLHPQVRMAILTLRRTSMHTYHCLQVLTMLNPLPRPMLHNIRPSRFINMAVNRYFQRVWRPHHTQARHNTANPLLHLRSHLHKVKPRSHNINLRLFSRIRTVSRVSAVIATSWAHKADLGVHIGAITHLG